MLSCIYHSMNDDSASSSCILPMRFLAERKLLTFIQLKTILYQCLRLFVCVCVCGLLLFFLDKPLNANVVRPSLVFY